MAVSAPSQMSKDAWEYLLKFTFNHEAPVYHMYNNRKSLADKQDVTFGVGVLINSPQAALGYKKYFFDKGGSPASDGAITDDWDKVSKILRTGLSVQEYENATQCRVKTDGVYDLMALKLKEALAANIKLKPQLSTFVCMPAQAQIALASYFYGHILPPMMGAAIDNWDFYEAGVQSHLKGMSERKYKAHVTLFENAAQIVAQVLEYSQVPSKLDPPELIPPTADKATAKAQGLAMSSTYKAAKIILPYLLNPLFIPGIIGQPQMGLGDKL